ncbi:WYL domain-containing protein [Pontimonas sp.]|uniref:helix-turn-helix transcriptional regulator n=1 Tax=Pontimonas sp. TaxID=2304492 RepID=UPI0028707114|nr:WYL domain-containing protein [Pontimonas sp.]MDR9396654.1 WYL domain-containing protein [Pontimonas sp.]
MAAQTIRPEDRLFHLILALMATTQGLSKEHILQTVRGYREDIDAGAQRATIERRFERDKDIVRELGIPLETYVPAEDQGNNKATLYRIPKTEYDPPRGWQLDAQDIRLLNTAAAVWREGSLSVEARLTHTKLAGYGVLVDEPLVGFLPMITARDPALDTLRRAVAEGYQVRFDYLTPGQSQPKTRTVSALSMVLHENRWHLLSVEEPGGSERTFLLRRIVSPVTALEVPARSAAAGQIESMTAELDELFWSQQARIEVTPGSIAALELAHRPGSSTEGESVLVHFTDAVSLGVELAGYGPDIRSIAPEAVQMAHREALNTVVAQHGR